LLAEEAEEAKEEENRGKSPKSSGMKPSNSITLLEYPNRDRVGFIFVLDGDIRDPESNQIELTETRVKHWVRVPAPWLNASRLLEGGGSVLSEEHAWLDVDHMFFEAEINARLKQQKGSLKKKGGTFYELRSETSLPFPCEPSFKDKLAREMETYIVDTNKHGYHWGLFWLSSAAPMNNASREECSDASRPTWETAHAGAKCRKAAVPRNIYAAEPTNAMDVDSYYSEHTIIGEDDSFIYY
jgi:hypothetical protein